MPIAYCRMPMLLDSYDFAIFVGRPGSPSECFQYSTVRYGTVCTVCTECTDRMYCKYGMFSMYSMCRSYGIYSMCVCTYVQPNISNITKI